MKKLKRKVALALSGIMLLGLMGMNIQDVSATIMEDDIVSMEPIGFSNQADDVFDGYAGMETTLTGRVGYNYAISLPNGNDLRFGFDPENTVNNDLDFSGIGSGWKVKLPSVDMEEMLMSRANGYSFVCTNENHATRTFNSAEGEYSLSLDSKNVLKYEDSYGAYEIYDTSGRITNITDSLDSTTTYEYANGLISKISYNDGTTIRFERTENEIDVVYGVMDESLILATFVLEDVDGWKILSEIKVPDEDAGFSEVISFEYMEYSNGGLLLKSFNNGRYERIIDYVSDSNKIAKYDQCYADGEKTSASYEYGQYDYIFSITKPHATETFTYEKLSDNRLKKNTVKSHNGTISTSTKTVNELGRTVEYTYPGTVLTLTYENGRLASQKENDDLYTYVYDEDGLIKQVNLPSGEVIERSTNEVEALNALNEINLVNNNTSRASSQNVSIIYDVNSEVGLTDFCYINEVSYGNFNCYGFAIGIYNCYRNPGYYSNNIWGVDTTEGLLNVTVAMIKSLTEDDLESLGRSYYDSNVSESFGSNEWKIAVRVRTHADYHFMKIDNFSSAAWEFKAGRLGGVMRLKNGKNPSQVSWDTYSYNSATDTSSVANSNYYTSAIKYMIIDES